jgi:hypothetical protein
MGTLPGGGATMLYLSGMSAEILAKIPDEDERRGAEIVLKSLPAPMIQVRLFSMIGGCLDPLYVVLDAPRASRTLSRPLLVVLAWNHTLFLGRQERG